MSDNKPRALYFKDHQLKLMQYIFAKDPISRTEYEKQEVKVILDRITSELERRQSRSE